MQGRGSRADQSLICYGVPVGSLERDCASLLYEEGSAFCGCYRCSH